MRTNREFDFESRKFNLLKFGYENFRYSASELKDVELNELFYLKLLIRLKNVLTCLKP